MYVLYNLILVDNEQTPSPLCIWTLFHAHPFQTWIQTAFTEDVFKSYSKSFRKN